MAVQNGRDLLIKMDMTGTGTFETIAGLRATRLGFNAETIDVTSTASAGGWRELLGLDDRVEVNVYSPQSPLGAAILGRKQGDAVSYAAPNGRSINVTVVKVEPYRG